jgi:hypothetical protein
VKEYIFRIPGNQEDPERNPVAYKRSTQGGQWDPGVRRYNAWKGYVQKHFMKAFPKEFDPLKIHPLTTSKNKKAYMGLKIFWAGGVHGDPDNIYKGIADALFEGDKYLACSGFDFEDSPERKGRVDVVIKIV